MTITYPCGHTVNFMDGLNAPKLCPTCDKGKEVAEK